MGKELRLGPPILRCYQKGRMMTMILSQNRDTLPWIYYNNMQICCHTLNEKGEDFVMDICNAVAPFITKEWDACPYIRDNSYTIARILKAYSTITLYIQECIDNNEYVHFCLNTKYVSAYDKNIYKDNAMHDIFICGYRDDDTFICYDYFGSDYIRCNIPFVEIEEAVKNIYECKRIEDYANGIHSFLLQKPYQFSFFTANDINREHILQKMLEIVSPKYSEPRNMMLRRENGKNIHAFGLDVYYKYAEFLMKNSSKTFDYRPFYVIKDHLRIVCEAVEFFDIPFLRESKKLYDMAIQLTIISLKEYVNHKDGRKERMAKEIINLKNKEQELINSILAFYKYRI